MFCTTRSGTTCPAPWWTQGDNRFGTDSVFHAQGTFNNFGTFLKSAGTGTTYGDIAFNNSGTVDAGSGTLDLAGGGTSTGAFTTEAGAVLEFGGGPHFLTASSSVGGAGDVLFGSETFNGFSMVDTGSYNITGTTTFRSTSGGAPSVEFDNDVSTGVLEIDAGTLSGVGNITINGLFSWTGGTLSGLGNVYANGGLVLSGSNGKTLSGDALYNAGAATWTGTGGLTANNGALLVNLPGALFDVQTEAGIGGGNSLFDNQGTFRKSTGTGTATLSIEFTNEGVVDLASGILKINGDYTQSSDGTLAVAISGTTPGTQYSRLQVTNLATLDGTLTVTLANGFVPASGNSFQVVTSGSLDGAFATLNSSFPFNPVYSSTSLTLVAP